jgi:hypothetical protein
METRALEVRSRLPAGLVGLATFSVLGAIAVPDFFQSVTFGIGVATGLSAIFLEPFFARPQDALFNGAGGIVAYIAIDKSPEASLWAIYLATCALVVAAGLAATLIRDDANPAKWLGKRVASTFGRAVVLGPAALLVDAFTRAARGEEDLVILVAGIAVLTGSVAVNWARLTKRLTRADTEIAVVLAAIGPRMLLASATGGALQPGNTVRITGSRTVRGTVIARLPHQLGVRYQIALDSDWTGLCDSFPTDVEIEVIDEPSVIVGSVSEGSTDLTIEFGPLRRLPIGSPVSLQTEDGALLYQVASLRLEVEAWSGASSIVPHATGRQIGMPREGHVIGIDYLPDPHQVVQLVQDLDVALPENYFRIGRLKGTSVPIGIQRDYLLRGHLAILGMSGMGKTAVAQRIARALGPDELIVVLDLTGEYSRRLGFRQWQEDLDTTGYSVYEPVGDPPHQAARFVNEMMQHAAGEYADQVPPGRTILLEEAHSFIPEWNFANQGQQARVNQTTRMIMQARKYGIRFIVVSQRTAVVSKSAISQCDNYIVFRTIDHTGLEYVETLAGSAFRQTLSSLSRYEALCLGPAFNSDQPVIVEMDPPPVDNQPADEGEGQVADVQVDLAPD